jgi:predicted O-methyltransferase YrrM
MDFLNILVEKMYDYAAAHTTSPAPALQRLERETHLKTLRPRMLSGELQGRFLSLLSKLMSPRRILEIGTFTGYATICLAEGLAQDGLIYTMEADEELEYLIQNAVKRADLEQKVRIYIGDALKLIPDLNEMFDLVFIDAGKRDYAQYFELVIDKVRSGGIIIADNVLWSGKVVLDSNLHDRDTKILDNFNKKLHQDPRVETLLLPLRDGLMIARKC